MTFWTNTKAFEEVHQYFRRHWQKALRIREKVRFSEEQMVGILREADPNRKWGKIFIADQILSLIRGDE